jgi:hypothetical protein
MPRPLGVPGSESRPAFAIPARFRPRRDVQQRAAALPVQGAVAVDDHDLLARGAQRVGELADRRSALEPAELAAPPRLPASPESAASSATRKPSPPPGAKRSVAVAIGSSAVGRAEAVTTLVSGGARPCGCAGPTRGLVDRVAVDQQHVCANSRSGHARLQLRVGQRAQHVERLLGAGAGAHVRGAEVVAQQLLEEERLLVGRRAAGQRADAVAGLLQAEAAAASALSQLAGSSSLPSRTIGVVDPLVGVHAW